MKDGNELKLLEILKSGSKKFIKADILAASALREAIIKGALSPGQEIDEEMIANKLNVSRTPVRQALGILEAEGLVNRPYRKGAFVTELTVDDLEELYNIRAYLEGLAINKAVPNYTKKHIKALKECLEALRKKMPDANSFIELNNRFHTLLYEPCEWDRLLNIITQLRNLSGRYMILAHEQIIKIANDNARHEDILEACENGDALLSEKIIRKHILGAMTALLENFNQY